MIFQQHNRICCTDNQNKRIIQQEAANTQQTQSITHATNQVQEHKNQEKQQSLQVYLFTLLLKQITLDVLIHPSEYKLIVNASQQNVTNLKTSIQISLYWFSCVALKKIIDEKDPQGLQKLIFPLFEQILEILDLKYNSDTSEYTYNLEQVKQDMPQIIQNYFATKLQQRFITQLMRKRYKQMQLLSCQKEIHLNTDLTVSTNVYFKKRWFLVRDKFQIKLIIKSIPQKKEEKVLKKQFYIDLLLLKKIFMDLANKKNSNGYIEPEYSLLLENNWTDIQGTFSKGYYEKTFVDLINYLNTQIQITVLYQRFYVTMVDTKIHLIEEKVLLQKQKEQIKAKKSVAYQKIKALTSAVRIVQKAFRKFRKQEWQTLKAQREKEKEVFVKALGGRVKRAFKEIDGCMYIVNIYQKDNIFTLDLILYNDRREKKNSNQPEAAQVQQENQAGDPIKINLKQIEEPSKKTLKKQLRGQFEYDPNSLLNTGSLTIPDYLLEKVAIENDDVIFQDNIFSKFEPGSYQNVKRYDDQQPIESRNLKTEENKNNDLYIKPTPGQSNIASNLVNYLFHEEGGKQFIYNVVYTGQKPQSEIKEQKNKSQKFSKYKEQQFEDSQEEQKIQSHHNQQAEENLQNEENENVNFVKINVDLNELKKLYPTIDTKSQGLMKVIGEQFIDGIKLQNDNNDVLIDQSRLNPKCIQVEENTVNMEIINTKIEEMKKAQEDINQRSKIMQQNQTVFENKKILLKQTRFFSKQKYLILIYIIERKVKKILNTAFDTVFEEYEVLYQINCINLNGKNQIPIIWEVTPEEVLIISDGIKDNMERARFLMRRIQVFNQKIIFTVLKKQHISKIRSNSNLIVYYEQGLIPIQNHFRNRRFRRNFQSYKDEIKQKHANIVHKCIPEELRSLTQYYLLACIDHKDAKDKWELVAWDMITFERYSKEIKSTEFLNYAAEFGRQVTVEFIAKFIDIDPQNNDLIINPGMTAYFKQYKEELKKKKAQKEIVDKKKRDDNYAQ